MEWCNGVRSCFSRCKFSTGYYFTGDGALRDDDNDYRITGRVDDMINCKGHRIGTAELECAMVCMYIHKL